MDSFLFDKVLENKEASQAMLEIILGREIPGLDLNISEKVFSHLPNTRGIRLDLYSIDAARTVYNSEAQNKLVGNIPKRSRYYLSIMDAGFLPPGSTDFGALPDTYIIFISPFDIYGAEKYMYTVQPMCKEADYEVLPDGTTRLFLNTRGHNDDEVRPELVELLHYMELNDKKYSLKTKSSKIKKIARYVEQIKASEEVGVRYLRTQEEFDYCVKVCAEERAMKMVEEHVEKMAEERAEKMVAERTEKQRYAALKLSVFLLENNRMEDIKRASEDAEYLQILFEEFHCLEA